MRAVKILIDIVMYGCFLYLMSYGAIHDLPQHGRVGIFLFILFVIHHVLNRWFYKTILKGQWNARRIFLNVTDWILFALMITMAISSIFMSGQAFEWSSIETTQASRQLHQASCCWGFMVMLVHLGIHLEGVLKKLENHRNAWQRVLFFIAYIAAIAAGIHCFKESQLYVYMFVTGGWKLAASSTTAAVLQLLGISAGVCAVVRVVKNQPVQKAHK